MKESHVTFLCETEIDQAVSCMYFVSGTLLSVNQDLLSRMSVPFDRHTLIPFVIGRFLNPSRNQLIV